MATKQDATRRTREARGFEILGLDFEATSEGVEKGFEKARSGARQSYIRGILFESSAEAMGELSL